ncbi:MAG: ATP-binding protein [Gammaproteobacteria bacterium]|jgi:predicted kinase|nr:ATP-binding protein [Gammaproteobacteria bacterium]
MRFTFFRCRISNAAVFRSSELNQTTLYFFCGKMGAGKSTHARRLAEAEKAVLISEDEWLEMLYPEQIKTLDDYLHYSARLRPVVGRHVKNLLMTGTTVVLDFPANTIRQRAWFKCLYEDSGAEGKLLYLKVSDAICLERLRKRRAEQPDRQRFDNEQFFQQVTQYFREPAPSEGFNVEMC